MKDILKALPQPKLTCVEEFTQVKCLRCRSILTAELYLLGKLFDACQPGSSWIVQGLFLCCSWDQSFIWLISSISLPHPSKMSRLSTMSSIAQHFLAIGCYYRIILIRATSDYERLFFVIVIMEKAPTGYYLLKMMAITTKCIIEVIIILFPYM